VKTGDVGFALVIDQYEKLHYQPAGPLIPLWDEWMPMATLWPARSGVGIQISAK
jgi:hypothetical protein